MTETRRTCGDCTACCDGWLSGNVNGHDFYPGMPCHYSGCNGCSIYQNRPESPCRTYSCQWLQNTEVPEWLKPNESGVILTGKQKEGPDGTVFQYLEVLEMGKKIDSSVLNWLFKTYLRTGVPMKIQIGGGYNWYGNEAFFDMCTGS